MTTTIKLSSRKTDKLDAFFAAFDAQTLQNPIGKGRIVVDNVLVDVIAAIAPDSVMLKEITTVTERGAGHASRALDWLCALADAHDVALVLHAKRIGTANGRFNHGGLTTAQLKQWYFKRGFSARAGGGHDTLIRKPKGVTA